MTGTVTGMQCHDDCLEVCKWNAASVLASRDAYDTCSAVSRPTQGWLCCPVLMEGRILGDHELKQVQQCNVSPACRHSCCHEMDYPSKMISDDNSADSNPVP